MATREEIEEIRERVDMVEILSRYLTLRKSGKNFVAICPFHPDKTPSLTVSPEKKLFHCFGCGEGGDIFAFLMKMERLDFPEVARKLAEEVGIELSEQSSSRQGRLRELNEQVAAYFQHNLLDREVGRGARGYLKGRGIASETIERFRLGYALPSWDSLIKKFQCPEELESLGLAIRGKDGKHYDRFRDRLIFTIFDPQGGAVGFAGRALRGSSEVKYVNVSNTPLFRKGKFLYGLNFAREASQGEMVLVEGYTDVLSAYQAGLKNAVASMGTALTDLQAKVLRRYVDRVTIAYDRDIGGRAASLRGMRSLRNAGLEVHVALLPTGEDPDSLIRRKGIATFKRLLEKALPFNRFYVSYLVEEVSLSNIVEVEGALKEAGQFIKGIESRPLRCEIIRELAEYFNLPEEEVELEMERSDETKVRSDEGGAPGDMDELWGPEEHLLYFLLQGDLTVEQMTEDGGLEVGDFSRYRGIIKEMFTLHQEQVELKPERLLEGLNADDQKVVTKLALTQRTFNDREKAVRDSITQLRLSRVEGRMEELRKRLKEADARGDESEVKRLYMEQGDLRKETRKLLRSLKRRWS